ncbi:MAG TPA: glycolate oxidase, partial [Geodermatophilus sp.]|nr:glycolate oxidase [Geodermatophilus sp.]
MTEITPGSHGTGDAPPPGSPGASPNTGPVRDSVADLPPGSPTGAVRGADEAPAAVVGARRPLDIGQDIDLPAGTGAATVGTPTLLGVPTTRQAVQPAFDEHHPPDPALIGDCVHCGFCLPTCPTYVLW